MKYYQRNARNYVGAEKTIQDWLLKPVPGQIASNGSECGNRLAATAKCVSFFLFSKEDVYISSVWKLLFLLLIVFDGFKCIEMEDQLMSVLNTRSEHELPMPGTIVLSHMIKERAHLLMSRKGEFSEVAMASFVVCSCP